jgi:hypothetical protein
VTFSEKIFDAYSAYHNTHFKTRYFGIELFYEQLLQIQQHPMVQSTLLGSSAQGRPIHQLKIGKGPQSIMLWSQMHGDEPTATMALFDVFNFLLNPQPDAFARERKQILEQCSLYFIPVLNPDGLVLYTRRNAQLIDINRDALATQSPEAQILKACQQSIKPGFSFNLHDQLQHWAAGATNRQATISFLATAYNPERQVNDTRRRAMQLIVAMNRAAQAYIPAQVGRFSDEFEPRAFGDNIQKWGSSLVLLEAGGCGADTDRQLARKLNFMCLCVAFEAIASQSYQHENTNEYYDIPQNEKVLFDLLLRNVTIKNGQLPPILTDIGIKRESKLGANLELTEVLTVDDLGDLSTFYGIEQYNAAGNQISASQPVLIGESPDFEILLENKQKITLKPNGWVLTN